MLRTFTPQDIQGIGMTSQRTRDRLMQALRGMGITNEDVLAVMAKTPRHLFVDDALASRAYQNDALPIGHGQTISQPYIVARMTELLLETTPTPQKVLEVGTGSGYQAAILSKLVDTVHSVERITELYRHTRDLLYALKCHNVKTSLSDGSWGLEQEAPFDAIIVTAAPEQVPEALLNQLKVGARLIIPTGQQNQTQTLQVITRKDEQTYDYRNHEAVQFVPLISD